MFCVQFCRSFFVLFRLTNVLSVFLFMTSDNTIVLSVLLFMTSDHTIVLSVLLLMTSDHTIVLSVLLFMASDYTIGIFKLFLSLKELVVKTCYWYTDDERGGISSRFCGVHVAQFYIFCVEFCRSLFVHFIFYLFSSYFQNLLLIYFSDTNNTPIWTSLLFIYCLD